MMFYDCADLPVIAEWLAAKRKARKKKGGDSLNGKGKGKKPMKKNGNKNCE